MSPGLWSTAETEVLVLSANLSSMNPIFKRLRPRSLIHKSGPSKDEESSHILENLDPAGHKTQPALGTQDAVLSTTGVRTADSDSTIPSPMLPDNAIVVSMGLKQIVQGL